MKVTTSDLLAILRRFDIAGDEHVPRLIDQVKQSHPSPTNQLVQFRFGQRRYLVLFDESAQDDTRFIREQIKLFDSNIEGELLHNPTSPIETYGLPFKGKDAYLFVATSDKRRLDLVLAERYPDISRSTWQKHIKAGRITVNGTPAKNSRQEVTESDNIAADLPEATDYTDRTLPIIYIDDHVIVVDKPAGVLTHSKGALNDEFTVADFFRNYTTVGLDTNRPGIVHRLDRDTSGVIIGARTPESFALLKSQFSERKAKKQYIAITDGLPKQHAATIDVPIGRNPSAPSTFRPDTKGKPAVTDYRVIATHAGKALISLQPLTGRTHQLRVHLKHIGTPIVGDRVYGKTADRLYLHAYTLELTTAPEQRMIFTAPLPPEFSELIPDADHAITQA